MRDQYGETNSTPASLPNTPLQNTQETPIKKPHPLANNLADYLSQGIVLADHHLTVSYLNISAQSLFACSESRFLGENLKNIFASNTGLIKALEDMVKDNNSFTYREVALTLAHHQPKLLDITATPYPVPTEEKNIILELRASDSLTRPNREDMLIHTHLASEQLVKGVAHEVKNPLGGIRGAAQLLARELPATASEYTNIIIGEVDRLKNLVDRMLGFQESPNNRNCNLHEILEHVIFLLKAEGLGAIEVNRDYDVSLPEFIGDRDRLIQAYFNILRNSVQALLETEEPIIAAEKQNELLQTNNTAEITAAKPKITIKTSILRQYTLNGKRHKLCLSTDITNNGPSIPADLQPNIFLPMISGRAKGTGLGLPLAQTILQQHNGLVEFESTEAKTRFSLIIPIQNN